QSMWWRDRLPDDAIAAIRHHSQCSIRASLGVIALSHRPNSLLSKHNFASEPTQAVHAGLPALPTAFGQFTVRLVLVDQKVIPFDSLRGGDGACQIVAKTRPFPLGHFDCFRSPGSWRRRGRRFMSAAARSTFSSSLPAAPRKPPTRNRWST